MTFIEIPVGSPYLARAINLGRVRCFRLQRLDTTYRLLVQDDHGIDWLLAETDSEDEALELWHQLAEAVRAAGGGWIPVLA